MDGLSPQSVQEQEAMKLQVLNEQEQAGVLQRNIYRYGTCKQPYLLLPDLATTLRLSLEPSQRVTGLQV